MDGKTSPAQAHLTLDNSLDGFTDKIDGNMTNIPFGYRRLEEILKANCAASTDEIIVAMKREFAAWQGTNARRDGFTVVVFML